METQKQKQFDFFKHNPKPAPMVEAKKSLWSIVNSSLKKNAFSKGKGVMMFVLYAVMVSSSFYSSSIFLLSVIIFYGIFIIHFKGILKSIMSEFNTITTRRKI